MQLQAELAVLLSRSSIVVLLLFPVSFLVTPYPPHTHPLSSHLLCFFPFFFWNVPVRFFHALAPPTPVCVCVCVCVWVCGCGCGCVGVCVCVCVCVCECVCIYILYIANPHTNTWFLGNRLKLIDCSRRSCGFS
jgi:hypothetical protein